jgi:CRISPR-associated protein (TIGR02710 family)
MSSQSHLRSPSALLISVGGSPNPVLYSIEQHHPDHIWFFCSTASSDEAVKVWQEISNPECEIVRRKPEEAIEAKHILARLRNRPGFRVPSYDLCIVERFEELGPCYEKIRTSIPELLKKWKVPPENVTCDYTGGTKTMSAALVLAAVEMFDHFSYIGGEQRDKGGVGITLDGKERVHYQQNPWSSLAIREVERARDLWAHCNFEAAADVLSKVAPRLPQPRLFEAFSTVARGLAARHRLDFRDASGLLGQAARSLPDLLDGVPDRGLISFVEAAAKQCGLCLQSGLDSQHKLLEELLDNALRTAAQNRFEDAALRLYRCMEMQLQIWLAEKTSGFFKNGARKDFPAQWPQELEALGYLTEHPRGGIKLGLEAVIEALCRLKDDRIARFAEDLDSPNPRLRNVASQRNQGILAHGTTAVGREGFERFKDVASEFFGFDLTRERHPIPPLDPCWLQFRTP